MGVKRAVVGERSRANWWIRCGEARGWGAMQQQLAVDPRVVSATRAAWRRVVVKKRKGGALFVERGS